MLFQFKFMTFYTSGPRQTFLKNFFQLSGRHFWWLWKIQGTGWRVYKISVFDSQFYSMTSKKQDSVIWDTSFQNAVQVLSLTGNGCERTGRVNSSAQQAL